MITIVTSFSGKGYKEYAARFIESYVKNRPLNTELVAYYHDTDFELEGDKAAGVTFRSLHDVAAHEEFYSKTENYPPEWKGQTPSGYNYRLDAHKFSHKVFAIWDCLDKTTNHVIWLDADTEFNVPGFDFYPYLDSKHITYLGRDGVMDYPETSFLGIPKFRHEYFINAISGIYLRGDLWNLREWHDGWVIRQLVASYPEGFKSVTTPGLGHIGAFMHTFGGNITHYKGPAKAQGVAQGASPLGGRSVKVEPKDCVPAENIRSNIITNSPKVSKWVKQCTPNDDVVIAISAGPSLKESLPEIRKQIAEIEATGRKARVICVKHAHNTLLENNIVPWGVVLLDPRPHDGLSTTGHKRSDLIAVPHPETRYFVATMAHPDVLNHLQNNHAQVVGWDAFTNAIKDMPLPPGRFWVTGGTCSAMRIIGLGHVLGFRDFRLWAYDGCVYDAPDSNEKDEQGRPKWLITHLANDPETRYYTTGEWLAMGQDFEGVMKEVNAGKLAIKISAHGRGMIPALYETMRLRHYEEIV